MASGGLRVDPCGMILCPSCWQVDRLTGGGVVLGALSLFEVLGVPPICWDSVFLLMVVERRLDGTSTCDTDDRLLHLSCCTCVCEFTKARYITFNFSLCKSPGL